MAAQGDFGKKYVVRLSGEERERLETLIWKGKSGARVLKARILSKADVSEAGKGWSDNGSSKLWKPAHPCLRVRKQLVRKVLGCVERKRARCLRCSDF